MQPKKSRFNRILLVVLAALFVLTELAFLYPNIIAGPDAPPWWMVLLNALILAIPLVLLYGGIYVVTVAWREHASGARIDPRLAGFIHWAPRAAAVAIIVFIALFSLDVFAMDGAPLALLGGFLVHNIPSIVLIVLLVIAWKRPSVGFWAFLAAAVVFTLVFVRDLYALPNLFLFVLPLLLVSALFYADWKWVQPEPPAPLPL